MGIKNSYKKNISIFATVALFYSATLIFVPDTLIKIKSSEASNLIPVIPEPTTPAGVMQYVPEPQSYSETVQPKPVVKRDTSGPNGIAMQAKAAYVYDMTTQKVLFAKNADMVLPLASLTKIMTAITALSMASPTTEITIHKEILTKIEDGGLAVDEKWSLKDLLRYTLVVSSNDGAAAIGEVVSLTSQKDFVYEMNTKAGELGLTQSRFLNESGLDMSETHAGAYGSVKDVATLLGYIVRNYPDVIEATKYSEINVTSLDGIVHNAKNTDIIATKIPNLLGGKTGYTDLAGGNLAVAFKADNGHTIEVVVMGSTYDGRFTDVANLVTFARSLNSF